MNGDLISRSALMKELKQRHLDDIFIKRGLPPMRKMSLECNRALKTQGDAIRDVINDMPAVDAEIVRHGKWKSMGDCGVTECSACEWNTEEYVGDYKYCPCCGAKVDADIMP